MAHSKICAWLGVACDSCDTTVHPSSSPQLISGCRRSTDVHSLKRSREDVTTSQPLALRLDVLGGPAAEHVYQSEEGVSEVRLLPSVGPQISGTANMSRAVFISSVHISSAAPTGHLHAETLKLCSMCLTQQCNAGDDRAAGRQCSHHLGH